jgi:hypothetical protein
LRVVTEARAWSFEPLGPALFPIGESPFRVRGLAYISTLDYVRRKTPGGFSALESAFAGEPFLRYFDQLFVALGSYDAAPLLRLFVLAAKLEHQSVAEFIQRRARASARSDAERTLRPLLSAKSLAQLAERLPLAFNRYFEPCRASVGEFQHVRFRGSLTDVPETMNGLYVFSTQGFVGACLESVGAKSVRFEWDRPSTSGAHSGVRVETLRFQVSWR